MNSTALPRRSFLAATLLASSTLPAAPARRRIRIAVKYNMIREDLDVADKFGLLRDLGYDGVEVYARDHEDLPRYRAATRRSGLPIHGVVNSFDPDISRAVEMASELGADSVLVLAREEAARSYLENFDHWRRLLATALPGAERHGIRLCIENVRATFLKRAEQMVDFIDSFASPYVRSYYDTGNTITWTDQSAEHWARALGHRIFKIDVKDRGHAEFGDAKLASKSAQGTDGGEVNWRQVRAALRTIDYHGWATAEVAGGDRKRLARMAQWMNLVLGN
jgi:L-ribulose-5-phosphate 3-epimerase